MDIVGVATSISSAIEIARRMKEVGDKTKNAEILAMVADLSLALSEAKMKLADSQSEKAQLQANISGLTSENDFLKEKIEGLESQLSNQGSRFGSLVNNPRLEYILKILKHMSDRDGKRMEISEIAEAAAVSVTVAEVLAQDMLTSKAIHAYHSTIHPTAYVIKDTGRQLLLEKGMIE